jgi:GNAT superfamily N-acetyltransferase
LVPVVSPEHWAAYHDVRRKVLYEDRGRLPSKYDSNHPDDRKPENHPVILTCDGAPVAAMRIDMVAISSFAIMRTVAVTMNHQRRGYGRMMLLLAEEYAAENGSTAAVVFSAPDAVGFYSKCGYEPHMWDPHGAFGSGQQMRKVLNGSSEPPTPPR